MKPTPQKTLGLWLLVALHKIGGSGTKAEALATMEGLFDAQLNVADWKRQPSNQEIKWRNHTAWERKNLVDSGFLEPTAVAGHGNWTMTSRGREYGARLSETVKAEKTRRES